jgi:hypothetical protein
VETENGEKQTAAVDLSKRLQDMRAVNEPNSQKGLLLDILFNAEITSKVLVKYGTGTIQFGVDPRCPLTNSQFVQCTLTSLQIDLFRLHQVASILQSSSNSTKTNDKDIYDTIRF